MKGVAFDLDGVITDTAQYHFKAWKKLAGEIGIDLSESFNDELKGISRMDSLTRILAYGKMDDQFSKEELQELATRKNNYYLDYIKQLTAEDILPGISALFTELQQAGIRIALASASKNAPLILERLGILDVFDQIVDPALIKRGKPFPDIFQEAAKLLDLTSDQCVGIEDAPAGVRSIQDAGMVAVAVGDRQALLEADKVFASTADLNLADIRQVWEEYHENH